MLAAPRGHDGAQPWQLRQGDHIRLTVEYRLLGLQHHEQFIRSQHIDGFHAERAFYIQGHAHFRRDDRRKIQPQAPTLTGHTQRTRLAGEIQTFNRLFVDFKQYVGTGQGRMTAQRNFGGRSKPADVPILAFTYHEGGFGQIVLGSDFLHQLIGEPGIQPINHRRVATEWPITERVDLMKLKLHEISPLTLRGGRYRQISPGYVRRARREPIRLPDRVDRH
ncbi:hypothetical protein D3C85_1310410 [compost metagenome]